MLEPSTGRGLMSAELRAAWWRWLLRAPRLRQAVLSGTLDSFGPAHWLSAGSLPASRELARNADRWLSYLVSILAACRAARGGNVEQATMSRRQRVVRALAHQEQIG
jgi:hypothetical protein